MSAHLLLRDVYGLVQDDPRSGFMASWHGRGSVVRHVMRGIRQKFVHREGLNLDALP